MKSRNPPRKALTKPAGGRPRQDELMTPTPDRIEPASESEAANDADAERDRILNAGVDYTLLDPRRILAAIAIDGAAPPGACESASKHDPGKIEANSLIDLQKSTQRWGHDRRRW